MPHLRIESHEKVVTNAKIFFVNGNEEIDISSCVQVVDLHIAIGEVATATMTAIVGVTSATARIDDIILRHIPKRRWWRRREPREITSVGDRYRRFA